MPIHLLFSVVELSILRAREQVRQYRLKAKREARLVKERTKKKAQEIVENVIDNKEDVAQGKKAPAVLERRKSGVGRARGAEENAEDAGPEWTSFDVSMLSSGQNMLQSVFGQLPTDIRETKVPVEHCCIGQHELRWDKEITTSVDGRVMELQPGTANLQRFPEVKFKSGGDPVRLEGGELEILMRLLVCSLDNAIRYDLWARFDMLAALPIHSLALSNTQASLDLLVRLVEERPELLPEAHGDPVFSGENVLHVLIVNRREDCVCRLLDIAAERLSDELMLKLLEGQATGIFFGSLPQRNFGGTPLAFAACFGMRRSIFKMLTLARPPPPDAVMMEDGSVGGGRTLKKLRRGSVDKASGSNKEVWVRHDSGEMHSYLPQKMDRMSFEHPERDDKIRKGVRVIHDPRGPGVVTSASKATARAATFVMERVATCKTRRSSLSLQTRNRSPELNDDDDDSAPIITLNDPHNQCKLTGFSPIHSAIALGQPGMVTFLLDLPEVDGMLEWPGGSSFSLRADLHLKTGESPLLTDLPAHLSPLQLAVFYGRKPSTALLLKRHMANLWTWGPLTCDHLFLDEIDSVFPGGNQVMELVSRLDARQETKEMLLDEFVDGFIYKLFATKWEKMCYREHYAQLAMQLAHVITLVLMTASKGHFRDIPLWHTMTGLSIVLLLVEEEVRETILFMKDREGHANLWNLCWSVLYERLALRLTYKLVAWVCSAGVSILIMTWPHDVHATNANPRREFVPMLLALALFFATQILIGDLLITSQKTGIYVLVVYQMLADDVAMVLLPYTCFLLNFSTALWPVLPIENAVATNDVWGFVSVVWSMLLMTFTGSTSVRLGTVDTDLITLTTPDFSLLRFMDGTSPDMNIARQLLPQFIVVGLFLYFVVLSIVLLLNLLIAQMSGTYERATEEGLLRWRWEFARRVMRLETLNNSVHTIHAGTLDTIRDHGGKHRYYVEIKGFGKTVEGIAYEVDGPDGGVIEAVDIFSEISNKKTSSEIVQEAIERMRSETRSTLQRMQEQIDQVLARSRGTLEVDMQDSPPALSKQCAATPEGRMQASRHASQTAALLRSTDISPRSESPPTSRAGPAKIPEEMRDKSRLNALFASATLQSQHIKPSVVSPTVGGGAVGISAPPAIAPSYLNATSAQERQMRRKLTVTSRTISSVLSTSSRVVPEQYIIGSDAVGATALPVAAGFVPAPHNEPRPSLVPGPLTPTATLPHSPGNGTQWRQPPALPPQCGVPAGTSLQMTPPRVPGATHGHLPPPHTTEG